MEWELVKPWVNRVGIVLEFLSFWLAAPEILGEERLKALERRLEKEIKQLPDLLAVLVAALAGMLAAVVLMLVVAGEVTPVAAVAGVVLMVVAAVATAAAAVVANKLQEKIAAPALRVLADDKRIRQRSLAVGGVLFVVGFLLQLIATF